MRDSSEGQEEGIHHERHRNVLTQPLDFLDSEDRGKTELDPNQVSELNSGENLVSESVGEQTDKDGGEEFASPASDDDACHMGEEAIGEQHKKKKKKKKVLVWLFLE
jgi:hypothetical protein